YLPVSVNFLFFSSFPTRRSSDLLYLYSQSIMSGFKGGDIVTKAKNIEWHDSKVTKDDRRKMNHHRSAVVWFTGLSGSGKSTISRSEEHTSELQSRFDLVCRLLLE